MFFLSSCTDSPSSSKSELSVSELFFGKNWDSSAFLDNFLIYLFVIYVNYVDHLTDRCDHCFCFVSKDSWFIVLVGITFWFFSEMRLVYIFGGIHMLYLSWGPVSVLDWDNWVCLGSGLRLDWVTGFRTETGPQLNNRNISDFEYTCDHV